jgi:hypothetical protein
VDLNGKGKAWLLQFEAIYAGGGKKEVVFYTTLQEIIIAEDEETARKIGVAISMIDRKSPFHPREYFGNLIEIKVSEKAPRFSCYGCQRKDENFVSCDEYANGECRVWVKVLGKLKVQRDDIEMIINPAGQVVGFISKNGKETGDGRDNGDNNRRSCDSELERQA